MERIVHAALAAFISGLAGTIVMPQGAWGWSITGLVIGWIAYDPKSFAAGCRVAVAEAAYACSEQVSTAWASWQGRRRKRDFPAWARAYDRWFFWSNASAVSFVATLLVGGVVLALLLAAAATLPPADLQSPRLWWAIVLVWSKYTAFFAAAGSIIVVGIFGLHAHFTTRWCEAAEEEGEEKARASTKAAKRMAICLLPPFFPFVVLYVAARALVFAGSLVFTIGLGVLRATFSNRRVLFALSVSAGATAGFYLDPLRHQLGSLISGSLAAGMLYLLADVLVPRRAAAP